MERAVITLKDNSKQKLLMLIGGPIILIAIGILLVSLTQPERSAASFCRVAKEEKAALTGDVSYEKSAATYKKLEAVAPDAIRSDIVTIRKGYEEMVKNPSSAMNVGFGIIGAENRRTDYITSNCKDF